MIIKLTPLEVSAYWDIIRLVVLDNYSVPNGLELDFTNDILIKVLSGNMQVWFDTNHNTVCITMILHDKVTNIRSLYIHTCSIKDKSFNRLKEVNESLSDYAIANECNNIVFDTSDDYLCEVSGRFGFSQVSTKFVKEI